MAVLISGQSARAVFIHGDTATAFTLDEPETIASISPRAIPYIFADATDVTEFPDLTNQRAIEELEKAWKKDRAIQLALIFLDPEEERETKDLAAECLDGLLEDESIGRSLLDRICISPMPREIDLIASVESAATSGRRHLSNMLNRIQELQLYISMCRGAWDELSVDLFSSITAKRSFEFAAAKAGVFRQFAEAGIDRNKFDSALLESLKNLSSAPRSREILLKWTNEFRPHRSILRSPTFKEIDTDEDISPELKSRKLTGHQAWTSVKKQKEAIVHYIKRGNLPIVRKFVTQLVDFQLSEGDPDHLVKSLCDLAQHAKEVLDHSLQLELSQKAFEILPTDGWASGSLGDAYFCLDQYDKALHAFDLAIRNGSPSFGENGKARILRGRGLLDEALAAYTRLIETYPSDCTPWVGKAEVLRDLWRLDDALSVYEQAAVNFPDEKILHGGKAAVLKELGRLEESLSVCQSNIDRFSDNVFPYASKADVLKEMGEFELALAAYDEAIRRFPDEVVPLTGRAGVLKDMRRFVEALAGYDEIIKNFRRIDFALYGRAEALKEMGRFEDASREYNRAIEMFPRFAVAYCGKAAILQKSGHLEEALRVYDQTIARFPREVVPRSGRAETLKGLGYLSEALQAYDELLKRNPHDKRLIHSKAAILTALHQYSKAEELLPTTTPETSTDWVAYHIRGMINLRKGELDSAIEIFKTGLAQNPWHKQLSYFRTALAIVHLKRNHFAEASNQLINHDEPLTATLRVHALGALGRTNEAIQAYSRIRENCPSILIPLRNELASRYLNFSGSKQSDEWVFEEECKAILLQAA